MGNNLFGLPEDLDLAKLVNDKHAYFLHQIGRHATLANDSLPPEEIVDMISFAALDTMKVLIPLALGVQYARDREESHLLAMLLEPMVQMVDLVGERHFNPSLASGRQKAAELADKMLTAYYQLREYCRLKTAGH